MKASVQQTRDQRRAKLVFDNVRALENTEMKKKYGAVSLSAAALIRTGGLSQAVAFFEAKNESHHKKFLNHLGAELKSMGLLPHEERLLEQVINSDLTAYLRLTQETIALCQWHKRFAQSILKVEPGEEA